jgi:hypothetical protein
MRPPPRQRRNASPRDLFFDLLTFDRRLAVPVMHLVYWAGLGIIALFAFGVIGAALGVSLREGLQGLLIAIPTLVAGFLIVGALVLIWRSFCEFYITIFKISEDLSALRAALETEQPEQAPAAPAPAEALRRRAPGA